MSAAPDAELLLRCSGPLVRPERTPGWISSRAQHHLLPSTTTRSGARRAWRLPHYASRCAILLKGMSSQQRKTHARRAIIASYRQRDAKVSRPMQPHALDHASAALLVARSWLGS